MKIWVVAAHDHVFGVDLKDRALRYTILTEELLLRGHKVVLWTSSFHHGRKEQRLGAGQSLNPKQSFRVEFLRGQSYRKNVSLARVLHNREIARDFIVRASREHRPDIILCSIPCLELAEAAISVARNFRCQSFVDVVDIWPDVYLVPFPRQLHSFLRLCLRTEYNRARASLCKASEVISISRSYLEWASRIAKRNPKYANIYYLGYPSLTEESMIAADASAMALRAQLKVNGMKKIVAFVGTFGRTYDIETLIAAAERLRQNAHLHFIFAGAGDKFDAAKYAARNLTNVSLPGWLPQAETLGLLKSAFLGLSAYANDAPQSLPYKPFEYMAFGLPQVSSLTGEFADILRMNQLGKQYSAGNISSLCHAILSSLNEDSEKKSQHIFSLYKERFDSRSIATRLAAHFERVLKESETVN